MKKKFIPAKLEEWKDRWMIVFHAINPITGKRQRFRRSYEINRIKDKRQRRKRAKELVAELNNELLPSGYPFSEKKEVKSNMKAVDALYHAVDLKPSTRETSINTYKYAVSVMISFLDETNRLGKSIDIVDEDVALEFQDWMTIKRKLSNTTRNNVCNTLRTLFYVLKERKIILKNPLAKFKKLPEEEKERRALTDEEKKVLSEYIKKKDPYMYLAVIIMYYCFIRKEELRRLKFRYFNFADSSIHLPGSKTKNKKSEIVTMPVELVKILVHDYEFHKQPQHYLVFGQKMQPHPDIPIGRNTMTNKHRRFVNKLEKAGKLVDGKSIHFYSWKDTGALFLTKKGLPIQEIQRQLRHKDLSTTQRYLQGFSDVIENIKNLKIDI